MMSAIIAITEIVDALRILYIGRVKCDSHFLDFAAYLGAAYKIFVGVLARERICNNNVLYARLYGFIIG